MASKGTRYSEEQIIRLLKEVENGISVAEVCRKYGVSEQTVYYRWRTKYGGLEASELQRLRELEAENARRREKSEFLSAAFGLTMPKSAAN